MVKMSSAVSILNHIFNTMVNRTRFRITVWIRLIFGCDSQIFGKYIGGIRVLKLVIARSLQTIPRLLYPR